MQQLIEYISPKMDAEIKQALVSKLEKAKSTSPDFFEDIFLKLLLDYHLATFFDNTIALETLIHQLRLLIVDNHLNIHTLGDELIEYDKTDNILKDVGTYLKKQGYVLVDFDKDPRVYYLSAVPMGTRKDLEKMAHDLGLFVQFF